MQLQQAKDSEAARAQSLERELRDKQQEIEILKRYDNVTPSGGSDHDLVALANGRPGTTGDQQQQQMRPRENSGSLGGGTPSSNCGNGKENAGDGEETICARVMKQLGIEAGDNMGECEGDSSICNRRALRTSRTMSPPIAPLRCCGGP